MEKQNVTLSLPKDILKKAKLLAVQRETSLSALLASVLTETVEQHERYAAARTANLAFLENAFDLGTGGTITWDRESLHDR